MSLQTAQRTLTITHPERMLWPEAGITKAHLIDYYRKVAPLMLAHLVRRPLVLTRYPEGVGGPGFYQKDLPQGAPPWVRTVAVFSQHSRRTIRYVVAEDPDTLVWLGQLAVIEIHPWLSRAPDLEHPDLLVVDLDPDPPSGYPAARQVASWVREALHQLGLQGVPKLSGATGVHVYVPIQPRYGYHQTSALVGLIGEALARLRPERVTHARRVRERGGRVYVDHLQNLMGKTVAGPFSPRPLPGAPVAAPITWETLPDVEPQDFTLRNADRWIPAYQGNDPLRRAMEAPQSLDHLLDRLPAELARRRR